MGGFLGPEFFKQGSLFQQIFLKHGWVFQNRKNSHISVLQLPGSTYTQLYIQT